MPASPTDTTNCTTRDSVTATNRHVMAILTVILGKLAQQLSTSFRLGSYNMLQHSETKCSSDRPTGSGHHIEHSEDRDHDVPRDEL